MALCKAEEDVKAESNTQEAASRADSSSDGGAQ